jgi:phosphotriesterase-related protein
MSSFTLMHEHITIDLSSIKKDADACLDCFDLTVAELKSLRSFGVENILDMTNIGMGRNADYVLAAAKESGINIFQSTGFYKEPFLPDIVYSKTHEELAEIMLSEINQGINNFVKASCIGEIGTSKNEMTQVEKKVFDAAVLAAKNSKVPIYTHTTLGTYALEQAHFFIDAGIDPKRIIIGHIDLCGDLDYIRRVLDTGVNAGFDTIGKNNYFPDEKRADFLLQLESEGRIDKIVLSLDITRKSHLKHFGGISYSYLFETFLPLLRRNGLKESSINEMLSAKFLPQTDKPAA